MSAPRRESLRVFFLSILPLVALSTFPSPSSGQTADAMLIDPSSEPVASPLEVFAELESCWAEGAADSLILHLAPNEIELSFRKMGPREGVFDHSQAKYLLRDLFRFAQTDSFHFTRYEYDPSEKSSPTAVGCWFYHGAEGIEREARVTIELTLLPEGWFISSIKTREW